MGLSYHEIGKRLNVDPSTVHRTVQLFEETGEVFSIQGHHMHETTTKKLSINEGLVIIEANVENPGAYLHELQQQIFQSTGTNVN